MYRVSAELYLRALGLVYVAAFVSFGIQVEGLIGDEGVRPASLTMTLVSRQLPGERLRRRSRVRSTARGSWARRAARC